MIKKIRFALISLLSLMLIITSLNAGHAETYTSNVGDLPDNYVFEIETTARGITVSSVSGFEGKVYSVFMMLEDVDVNPAYNSNVFDPAIPEYLPYYFTFSEGFYGLTTDKYDPTLVDPSHDGDSSKARYCSNNLTNTDNFFVWQLIADLAAADPNKEYQLYVQLNEALASPTPGFCAEGDLITSTRISGIYTEIADISVTESGNSIEYLIKNYDNSILSSVAALSCESTISTFEDCLDAEPPTDKTIDLIISDDDYIYDLETDSSSGTLLTFSDLDPLTDYDLYIQFFDPNGDPVVISKLQSEPTVWQKSTVLVTATTDYDTSTVFDSVSLNRDVINSTAENTYSRGYSHIEVWVSTQTYRSIDLSNLSFTQPDITSNGCLTRYTNEGSRPRIAFRKVTGFDSPLFNCPDGIYEMEFQASTLHPTAEGERIYNVTIKVRLTVTPSPPAPSSGGGGSSGGSGGGVPSVVTTTSPVIKNVDNSNQVLSRSVTTRVKTSKLESLANFKINPGQRLQIGIKKSSKGQCSISNGRVVATTAGDCVVRVTKFTKNGKKIKRFVTINYSQSMKIGT